MGFYTGTHNVKFRLSSRRKVRIAYNKRFVQSCVKTRKPVISKKRVLLFRRKKMYAITSSVKPQIPDNISQVSWQHIKDNNGHVTAFDAASCLLIAKDAHNKSARFRHSVRNTKRIDKRCDYSGRKKAMEVWVGSQMQRSLNSQSEEVNI